MFSPLLVICYDIKPWYDDSGGLKYRVLPTVPATVDGTHIYERNLLDYSDKGDRAPQSDVHICQARLVPLTSRYFLIVTLAPDLTAQTLDSGLLYEAPLGLDGACPSHLTSGEGCIMP